MRMKPRHKRFLLVIGGLGSIFFGVFILLDSFRDNLVYFHSPSEIAEISALQPQRFERLFHTDSRIGGMVKERSHQISGATEHEFILTDYGKDFSVIYSGLLPPMFREGQGVVAQGRLVYYADGIVHFQAKSLLTKHDEKYMPPEIERSLKKE